MNRQVTKVNLKIRKQNIKKLVKSYRISSKRFSNIVSVCENPKTNFEVEEQTNVYQQDQMSIDAIWSVFRFCSRRPGECIPTRPNVYRCNMVSIQIVED